MLGCSSMLKNLKVYSCLLYTSQEPENVYDWSSSMILAMSLPCLFSVLDESHTSAEDGDIFPGWKYIPLVYVSAAVLNL